MRFENRFDPLLGLGADGGCRQRCTADDADAAAAAAAADADDDAAAVSTA